MSQPLPSIHVFHGNAGGTGKTLLASLLADYFIRQGKEVSCFYSGPGRGGLSDYKSLRTKTVMENYDDLAGLDQVFESTSEVTILDCAPAGYDAFIRYIRLKTLGLSPNWLLHVPTAAFRLFASRGGLEDLAPYMPLPLVLWLNGYGGNMPSFSEALEKLGRGKADFRAMVRLTPEECHPLTRSFVWFDEPMTLTEMLQQDDLLNRTRLRRFQESFDRCVHNLFDQLS